MAPIGSENRRLISKPQHSTTFNHIQQHFTHCNPQPDVSMIIAGKNTGIKTGHRGNHETLNFKRETLTKFAALCYRG